MKQRAPLVITFSASDPIAGAGLQADVLTLSALGVHPLTVVTGLTAQNTVGVQRFEACSARWIEDQLRALLDDGVVFSAIKAGVLGSLAAVRALSALKTRFPDVPLVLDPVRASGRGDSFGDPRVWKAMRNELLPVVDLLTPNWPEAQAMTQCDDEDAVAHALLGMGCGAVLLKGEHQPGAQVINRLYRQGVAASLDFPCERLAGQFHGSGCTLASACAAGFAQGLTVIEAVPFALEFTWHALKHGFEVGQGQLIPDRMHLMRQWADVAVLP